ncbi:MAG: HAMP domain-containing sensor histidine kinase [Patescibacteria group bacterium]
MEQLCPWETAQYFIYSSNIPTLFFYSHIPAIIVALLVGFLVFYRSGKSKVGISLLTVSILFSLWCLFDLIVWATNRPDVVLFFWSLQILVEPFVYLICFYLAYIFIKNKDLLLKWKLLAILLYLPVVLLLPTNYSLIGVNVSTCNAIEGFMAQYFTYIIESVFILSITFLTIFEYRKISTPTRKKEVMIFGIGIVLFLIAFSSGNLIGSFTENWTLAQVGLIGMPIFIGFLMYGIVKYKTFNIKLVGSFALVFSLATLNFSMIFISQVETLRIVTTVTFLLTIIFGIALIKNILLEIKQNQAIEQLIKARSDFLTVASHQLRTPVSLITGTLSLMQDGTIDQLPPDQKAKLLEGIFVKSRKLTCIINDILQASEMDIMNFHLSKEAIKPLDVQKLLKKVYTDLQEKADASKITLTYEQVASDKAVMVSGNEHYLENALFNIVDNAIKYTPKGFVKMELLLPEIGTNKVIVKISDSGIGVPVDDQPKIFEKFTRARNAVNSYADGSGLGLFIVKKIIEAHPGGKIYFISPGEGKGTTFYVELTKS